MTPITFAHRGARIDHPENTVEAFTAALAAGVRGIETDAWLSGDGEVVLVHDGVAGRGLRRRRVRSTSAAELANFGVPRLADVYAALGTDFELSVDIKHAEAAEPLVAIAAAAGDDALERLWLCSPDVHEVMSWRRTLPRAVKVVHSDRRESISTTLERHAHDLGRAEVDAMNLHHTEWTSGLVSLFHRFGVLAFAWDVQEVRHLRAALAKGVDALYCDRPDRLVAVVSEWK